MSKRKRKEGWIVPGGEKVAMMLGYGSIQAMNTYVATFLATYLLMIGIDPLISAGAMLVLKVWDSVNDVLFGFVLDKYRFRPGKNVFTRWLFGGRYMPWFRIIFPLIPVGTIIIFSINTALPLWMRVAQYFIGYVLFDAGCTIGGAMGLLPLTVTNNYDERNFILAWNGLGQGFGSLPVVFLGNMFIAGSLGYTGAAFIFSLLGVVLAVFPAFFVKERNPGVVNPEVQERYTIREMFRALKKMPELLFMMLGNFLWGIFYTGGYGLFVAYYIFGDAGLSVIMSVFAIVPTVILVPFLPMIFKRVDKLAAAKVCCLVFVICGILTNVLGAGFLREHMPVLYILTVFQSTAYIMVMFSTSQAMVDLLELAKYRTRQEVNGIVSSAMGFVSKMVNSLVASVTLLILSAYGFVAVEAGSFEELAALNAQGIGLQTDLALKGLWNVSYLFPIIGFALAAVAYSFIKLPLRNIKIYMQANSGEISREEAERLLAEGEGKVIENKEQKS